MEGHSLARAVGGMKDAVMVYAVLWEGWTEAVYAD